MKTQHSAIKPAVTSLSRLEKVLVFLAVDRDETLRFIIVSTTVNVQIVEIGM